MPAIVTDRFKKETLLDLLADIADSANNYYVAVSKPTDWNDSDAALTPLNTEREIRNARLNMMSVKNVEASSLVIPRYNWSLGAVYQGYNDNISSHPVLNPYYVMTEENQVYICLEPGRNATTGAAIASTVKPTGTLTTPFKTSDGYIWKFCYSVGALRASNFLAANFIPIELYTSFDSASPADHVEQVGIRNAAVPKQITGFTIVSGGSGFTSTPTVTVVGNGTNAKATATVSGGTITKVVVKDSSDGSLALGSGYDYAHTVVSGGGGTGANIRPILGPRGGLGYDPRDELRASAIMFTASPDGAEGSSWVVGNDFRQISLLKNPKKDQDVDSDFTAVTGNAMKRLSFASITSSFTADKTIQGASSGAKATVVKADSDEVWFVQDELTLFTAFTEGETVSETNGTGTGALRAVGFDADSDAFTRPDVDIFSGEILYLDNRAAVQRSADQTEDIKIIIQL